MSDYTFFCDELGETLKVSNPDRREAFIEANQHFKPMFESSNLKFEGWNPDNTKSVMTAKISKK